MTSDDITKLVRGAFNHLTSSEEKLLVDAFDHLTSSQIKMLSNSCMGLPILNDISYKEVKKLDITFTINIINI